MNNKIKAAVMTKPNEIIIKEFTIPKLENEGDILIKPSIIGICGTDKHSFKGEMKLYVGTDRESDFKYPIIPGHETIGIVADVKGKRYDFKGNEINIGDKIYVWPDIICGKCYYCHLKDAYGYAWCEKLQSLGVTISCNDPPYLNGGMAELEYISNNVFIYKIPLNMPDEHSVLAELLSFFFDKEVAGWNVVVQGIGALGICQVIKMRGQGAGKIIAIERSEYRLDMAKEFGADLCINVSETSSEERVALVREATGGYGADMAIECVGLPHVIPEGIEMLRMGGYYIEMGNYVDMGNTEINPHKHLCTKNVNIRGISNHPYCAIDNALSFIKKYGKDIPFEKIITHKFKLSDIEKAFKTSIDINSMKVVILPNE